MAAQILDGKAISAELRGTIAQRVARLREKGVTPGLAVILVGADPASQIYVRNKSVGCDQVGIHSVTINLPETTTQDELEKLIARLNADDTIHGILVQLPLPEHRAGEGCGRLPPAQRGADDERTAGRGCVHAQGRNGDDSPHGD